MTHAENAENAEKEALRDLRVLRVSRPLWFDEKFKYLWVELDSHPSCFILSCRAILQTVVALRRA
jgi:hypothetical protein